MTVLWPCLQDEEATEDTAGQLGLLQSADEGGGELMLFQLPSALPMPPLRRNDGVRRAADGRDAAAGPTAPSLADLPSGKVSMPPPFFLLIALSLSDLPQDR